MIRNQRLFPPPNPLPYPPKGETLPKSGGFSPLTGKERSGGGNKSKCRSFSAKFTVSSLGIYPQVKVTQKELK